MNTTLAAQYGVRETNGITEGYHDRVTYTRDMTLAEVAANGGHISRVRLLTEVRPGYGRLADVSYIHATLADGTTVPVCGYPATGLLRNVKRDFIEWAKEQGVFAKGLGLIDELNWSILY